MSRKHVILVLKIAVSVGLVWLILHEIAPDWKKCGDQMATALRRGYFWLIGAVIMAAAAFWLAALRWKTIVGGHEVRMGFAEAFRLSLVGFFFGQFMPGGLAAGDVVRSYYVASRSDDKKMEVVSTVVVDRVVGFFGAVGLVAVSILLGGKYIAPYALVVGVVAALVAFGTILFFSKGALRKLPFAGWVYEHLPYREHLTRAYEAFLHYREHKKQLLVCWGESVASQLLLVAVAYCVGESVGVQATPVQYLVWVPLVGAISWIPITFGSIGTAEAGYALLFLQGEHPEAYDSVVLAFMLMMRLLWLLAGAIGGVVWWAEKGKIPGKLRRQEEVARSTASQDSPDAG